MLAKAQVSVEAIRQDATSRQQLEAQLVGQARAYAIQRYMYGSADSRDLLAFLSALNKPADDAVWGLATLEGRPRQAALDQAAAGGQGHGPADRRPPGPGPRATSPC